MHSKTAVISFFLALTLLVSPAAVSFLIPRVDAQNITATNATNATSPIEVPPLVPPPTNETLPPVVVENITEVPPIVITNATGNETTSSATPTSNVTIVSSNSLIGFDQFTGLNTLDIFGIAFNEGPADSTNTTLMTALFDFNGTIIAANTSTTFPSTILVNQSIPIDVHFDDLDIVGGVFNAAFYQQQADNGSIFFGTFPLPPPPVPVEPLPPVDGSGVIVPGPGGGEEGGGVPPAPPVDVVPPPPAPLSASLQECLDSYPQNQDICTIGGEIDCNILIAAGVFDFPVVQGSVDPFALDADGDGIGCELFALPSPSGGPAPPAPIEEAPVPAPPANGDQVPVENVTSPELPGGATNETEAVVPPELITPPGTNATNMTGPTEPTINATEPAAAVNNTLADSEEPPTEEDQQAAEESQDDQPQEDKEQSDNGNDDNN